MSSCISVNSGTQQFRKQQKGRREHSELYLGVHRLIRLHDTLSNYLPPSLLCGLLSVSALLRRVPEILYEAFSSCLEVKQGTSKGIWSERKKA
jgi:hypothetical protein